MLRKVPQSKLFHLSYFRSGSDQQASDLPKASKASQEAPPQPLPEPRNPEENHISPPGGSAGDPQSTPPKSESLGTSTSAAQTDGADENSSPLLNSEP